MYRARPYENPEIAMAVRVANGYTSDYAAQIAKDVVAYYYDLAEEEELKVILVFLFIFSDQADNM